MSLSPYRDESNSFSRSRSSSFSSPTTAKFLFQEIFAVNGNAMIRSYSCDHVFTNNENGQTFQSAHIHISNFVTPLKRTPRLTSEKTPKFWSGGKKVKLDHRDKQRLKAKVALAFSTNDDTGSVHISPDSKLSGRLKYLSLMLLKVLKKTTILVLLIAFLLSWFATSKDCNKNWDTHVVAAKLRESVFGQEIAIARIIEALEEFSNSNSSTALAFTGATGVGKTYVSSIIYDYFPWVSNEHVKFFDYNLEETIQKKFSYCGANLLIIDGINILKTISALKSTEKIINSLNNHYKLLLILIFRVQNDNEELFVLKNVHQANMKIYHIPFKHLGENDILQCFGVELKRQQKTASSETLKKLVNQQMEFCNLSRSFPGCKKVFHEVSYLYND